jgi:iron(III) transport system substrate-binding protein
VDYELTADLEDWGALVTAARSERPVVLSAPRGNDLLQPVITQAFPEATGVQVDYRAVGAQEMLPRLAAERAAGAFSWDVLIGGTDSFLLTAKDLGYLDPIVPALRRDVSDGSRWAGGELPFWDNDGIGVAVLRTAGQYFFVNTTMADPRSIRTYWDLLEPQWRGRILLTGDPRKGGHSRSVFTFFFEHPALGPDFLRRLWLDHDLRMPREGEDAGDLVASGAFAMCIANRAQQAILAREKLPYELIDPHQVAEGIEVTSSFANCALVNRAPHPNAARVFLNWLLSAEAGRLISDATGLPSTRADVSKANVPSRTIPDPDWPVANTEANLPNALRMVEYLNTLGRQS